MLEAKRVLQIVVLFADVDASGRLRSGFPVGGGHPQTAAGRRPEVGVALIEQDHGAE